MNRQRSANPPAPGFSLVEVMVAMVIGLVATLVIMQMFTITEGRKRTSTGGADAQTNAAVALYMIERDVRQAGYGLAPNTEDFIDPADEKEIPDSIYLVTNKKPPAGVLGKGILAQCTKVNAYNKNRTGKADFAYENSTFAPIVINPPGFPIGDANTDVILVNYTGSAGVTGKGLEFSTRAGASAQQPGDVSDYAIDGTTSRAGIRQGDLILTIPPVNDKLGLPCSIAEVTGLPAAAGQNQCKTLIPGDSQLINHNAVSYENFYVGAGCGTKEATWNKANETIVYPQFSKLYNLGPVGEFVSRVYAVRKGNLTVCDLTATDCTAAVSDPPDPKIWVPIASQILALKAQYGKDPDFDGHINSWDKTQPVGASRAAVTAFRMAVLARSSQYEKEDVTNDVPSWRADAPNTSNEYLYSSSFGGEWKRYRYKVAQSIVPLRNMIWGGQLK